MRTLLLICTIMSSFYSYSCVVVPFTRLISAPSQYNGKCIQTVGVISVEFEGARLYLNRESYLARIPENSLRHDLIPDFKSDKFDETLMLFTKNYEGKLVRYTGVYQSYDSFRTLQNVNGYFETYKEIEIIKNYVPLAKLKGK
jgi:hypothetical protein